MFVEPDELDGAPDDNEDDDNALDEDALDEDDESSVSSVSDSD